MLRGKKPIGPVDFTTRGVPSFIGQYDVRWEFIRLGSQSVGGPSTHDRESVQSKARVLFKGSRRMVCGLGYHRTDDRQFIGNLCQPWEQVRDPQTAFSSLSKSPIVFPYQPDLIEECYGTVFRSQGLSVKPS